MILKCTECGALFDSYDALERLAEPEDGKIRGSMVLECPKCRSAALEEYYPVKHEPDLTPEEFLAEMKTITSLPALEDEKHMWADDLMCDLLRSMGYGDGVDVYDQMEKWYS